MTSDETPTSSKAVTDLDITLIGATGLTGSHILHELLDRGYRPRCITRRAGSITDPHVAEVIADVFDRNSLIAGLAGSSVVINAFAPAWDDENVYERYLDGVTAIHNASRTAGVGRLLVIGGATSLLDAAGRPLIETLNLPASVASAGQAACEYLDRLRHETEPDWTVLTPPPSYGRNGPTGRRGHYRVGRDEPVSAADGTSSISGQDLATALVDEMENGRFPRGRFTVGY